MNKTTAIILMVLMSLTLIGGGAVLVSTGTAAAGWVLVVVGSVASLSTMGVLARETK